MASEDIAGTGGGVDPWAAFLQAMGNAALNAAEQQEQVAISAQSATTMGIATLFAIDTATLGMASKKLLDK